MVGGNLAPLRTSEAASFLEHGVCHVSQTVLGFKVYCLGFKV